MSLSHDTIKRLNKEFKELLRISSNYWSVRPKGDSLAIWEGNIHDLDDPRHRNKNYPIEITIPHNYPFKPPTVKFLTRINCENVYADGTLCIDILGETWSPAFTIPLLMISICSVLTDKPVTGEKYKTLINQHSMRNEIPRNTMAINNGIPKNAIEISRRRRRTEVELLQS